MFLIYVPLYVQLFVIKFTCKCNVNGGNTLMADCMKPPCGIWDRLSPLRLLGLVEGVDSKW